MNGTKQIDICICSYQRPLFLERLLKKIGELKTDGSFVYSVVIVDNDASESAREVVSRASRDASFSIEYNVEPERSISRARNMLVDRSRGDLIAFIDDDEFPDKNWLLFHYQALLASGADGVLGPVLPHFNQPPPKWLPKSGLVDRRRFPTYSRMEDPRYLRTGNVLLWRRLFIEDGGGFDPKYGKSGGGDAVFFRQMIQKGKRFIWCDEACVSETVTPERQNLGYYIRRAFTRGMTSAWETPFLSSKTLKSVLATILYTMLLPFAIIPGKHFFARILVKDCDHVAKLLEYAGVRIFKERPYGSSS